MAKKSFWMAFRLTLDMRHDINWRALRQGISRAELIRRAVQEYLEKDK